MDNPNLQPQSDAMAEAIARRGLGQQAPQMTPQMAPQGPAPQMPSMGQPQGSAPAKFEPSNKEDFIVSTLAEELKRSHDLKKEQMKLGQAPMM